MERRAYPREAREAKAGPRWPIGRSAAAVVVLCFAATALGAPDGFFTAAELARIDEALDLLNMTRFDAGFDKKVIDDDWRLSFVDRTLDDPLYAADALASFAETAAAAPSVILRRALASLEGALEVEGPPLSQEEIARLASWAYASLVSEDCAESSRFAADAADEDPGTMLALARRFDRAAVIREAIQILARVEGAADFKDLPWPVVFGADGDDVHDLSGPDAPVVLVDPGGNDRYIAPARTGPDRPLAIVIDLAGDDVYGDGESLSGGAGFCGVGVLIDRGGGNDRYHGGQLSLGCGVFGVGVLVDDGGRDDYRIGDMGQGAGAWGVGLLLDRGEGNDRFSAHLFAQGFAYTGGFGLLQNEAGNDAYDAGGVHLHYPLYNDRFQSLSQGFSIGIRPIASGGIGLLVDDEGNDRYAADIYGHGSSYWFSYGGLFDRSGHDAYTLGQYGQGAGIHLSTGCLIDLAGDDLYHLVNGVGMGGAHDFAVGILVDRVGSDYYAGSGATQGGALTNSFALLLDGGGDDGYSAIRNGAVQGGASAARGMGSIGLLVDLGGADMYGSADRNGAVWTRETYGAGLDVHDPAPSPATGPGANRLSPEAAAARLKADAWDDAAGAFDLERLWSVACRWAVGEMADVVPLAIEELARLGRPALERALAAIPTTDGLEMRAITAVLQRFPEEATPALVERAGSEDDDVARLAAGFLADLGATSAAEALVPLLDRKKSRVAALDALARLAAREHFAAVVPLLADATERVRVSAIRTLEAMGADEAIPDLAARLAHGERFTVRFAAEDALVALGAASRPTLRRLAAAPADLTARRHAIRALGRLASPGDLPLLADLAGDEEWRIRFDAAGALTNYLGAAGESRIRAEEALRTRRLAETDPRVRSRL